MSRRAASGSRSTSATSWTTPCRRIATSRPGRRPARRSSSSDEGREAHQLHIGAELSGVSLAEAITNDDLFAEIRSSCFCAQGAVPARSADQQAPSMSPSRGASASWRTIRSPAATRTIPAWCASTRTSIRRPTITRTRGIATPPGARRRRWARCCAAWNARPSAATPIWANMAQAYDDLPDHIKDDDRRPARAPLASRRASARACRSRSGTR